MSKKQQIILGLSLTILTLTVISIALTSRFISVECALCKEEVQKISYLEKELVTGMKYQLYIQSATVT